MDEGLLRCGKSCRLRWMNYLRPNIKRGNITPDEDDLIIRLHSLLGNRWSLIAGRLPGRTDNEIKNYWNTHLSKKLLISGQGTDPNTDKKWMKPGHELKTNASKNKVKTSTTTTTNNNKSNNRKMKNKGTANVEPEKQKIHLPKPTRITSFPIPRNESFDCSTISGSSGQEREDIQCFGSKVEGILWCDIKDEDQENGAGFLIGGEDHHHGLIVNNGSDFECHSNLPTGDNSLEKLYEEYLELLKTDESQIELDSFAESLLL